MATHVAATASVDPRAQLDDGVEVGPFCVVGPRAKIGQNTVLHNNVTLMGDVALGCDNEIYPNVVIGGAPQDVTYAGAKTRVILGDNNVIREGVTINRASEKENGVTRLGDHNFLMACCHVAHDCKLGSHIVIANNTLLGGHVHVHDYASLSGNVAVHHYSTIGSYAFVGGLSGVRQDVPPFMLAEGVPARPRCINAVGLRRNDFPADVISALADAHRLLFRSKVGLDNAWDILRNKGLMLPQVNQLLTFLQHQYEGSHGRGRERRMAA